MMQQVICDHDAVLVLFITTPAHINQAAPIIVFVNYSLIVLYSPAVNLLIPASAQPGLHGREAFENKMGIFPTGDRD